MVLEPSQGATCSSKNMGGEPSRVGKGGHYDKAERSHHNIEKEKNA